MWRAVRRARVAAALGEPLGRALLEVRSRRGTVELELAGSGWQQALAGREAELRACLAGALGAPVRAIVVRERDGGWAPATAAGRSRPGRSGSDPHVRLRDVARRLLARRGADGPHREPPFH